MCVRVAGQIQHDVEGPRTDKGDEQHPEGIQTVAVLLSTRYAALDAPSAGEVVVGRTPGTRKAYTSTIARLRRPAWAAGGRQALVHRQGIEQGRRAVLCVCCRVRFRTPVALLQQGAALTPTTHSALSAGHALGLALAPVGARQTGALRQGVGAPAAGVSPLLYWTWDALRHARQWGIVSVLTPLTHVGRHRRAAVHPFDTSSAFGVAKGERRVGACRARRALFVALPWAVKARIARLAVLLGRRLVAWPTDDVDPVVPSGPVGAHPLTRDLFDGRVVGQALHPCLCVRAAELDSLQEPIRSGCVVFDSPPGGLEQHLRIHRRRLGQLQLNRIDPASEQRCVGPPPVEEKGVRPLRNQRVQQQGVLPHAKHHRHAVGRVQRQHHRRGEPIEPCVVGEEW
mmetsp:Transcript_28492/g.82091  ORF Transcript_28492/g.82091 Transcript_28492/m.82091 type:complete len:399 (+) Transcript_28492:2337-3533(+)